MKGHTMRWIMMVAALFFMGAQAVMAQDADLDTLLNQLAPSTEATSDAPEATAAESAPEVAPAEAPEAAPATEPKAPAAAEKAPGAETDSALADLLGALKPEPEAKPEPEPAQPVEPGADAASEPAGDDAVAKPEVPVLSNPDIMVPASTLATEERIRRQAMEEEGKIALADGKKALDSKDYKAASDLFAMALKKIPGRPDTDEVRREATAGLAESAYMMARSALGRDNLEEAQAQAEVAKKIDPQGHGEEADKLIERVNARKADKRNQELARARQVDEKGGPEVLKKKDDVAELYEQGVRYFEVEEYDLAEQSFERALLKDPYHKDSMRFLKRIEDRRIKIAEVHRGATISGMMHEVRDGWNPPIRQDVSAPAKGTAATSVETISSARVLQDKMRKIMIPSIEFRQANIVDVISFLQEASIANDPDGYGVNIILKLEPGTTGQATTPLAPSAAPDASGGLGDLGGLGGLGGMGDLGGLGDLGGGSGLGATESSQTTIPLITMNLRRVNLLDALKYVTEVAGLKYRIEDTAVIITSRNAASGPIITRMYPVQPSFMDLVVQRSQETAAANPQRSGGEFIGIGGGETTMTGRSADDVKKFFMEVGVAFPQGSSISYNSSISNVIVANTAENLETFERILAALNVVPNQVEIEARFVEVAQSDLEAIGFEWLLTDSWEIATKNGPGPVTAQERIQVNGNGTSGGFTSGLRFFDLTSTGIAPSSHLDQNTSMMGQVLGVSSILTNPQLTMILHAISQMNGSDLLSAPRVTTRSGVNAQIRVVREIIYPTEFESEVSRFNAGGGAEGTDEQMVTIIPQGFETREVGVIMNVTPTVGPDGYTIDLTMVPEVSELVDWLQYGSQSESVSYNIPQPVFATRSVSTSIVVWDGHTVVMGGLMREQLSRVDDKIPLLGDIPLIGRLFRSEGEYSQKSNLLIFVTARLVNPAGNRIRKEGEAPMAVPSVPSGEAQP